VLEPGRSNAILAKEQAKTAHSSALFATARDLGNVLPAMELVKSK
jgi:hypothetical protein